MFSITFGMTVRKAQLSGNLFEPVPQFPTLPHEQDEDVHAVVQLVQVSYFFFSLPEALLVVSWLHKYF